MRNERYHYSVMAGQERAVYKTMYEGLRRRAPDIAVSMYFEPEQVRTIYLKVLYDNPHLYFINQYRVEMTGAAGNYVLKPEYIYTEAEIDAINNDIRSVLAKVDAKASTLTHNEFRLEKYLHDSVVKSVAYDYESLKKSDCYNAHSIVGAFLENKAVCDGISKAFKVLCNTYGIKCIVALGKASLTGDFSGDCHHAWNVVKVGGESYHVDVTWDNEYDGGLQHISYDYFNVTTENILKDHRPLDDLPFCSATALNYFHCSGSIVTSYVELVQLLVRKMDASEIMFMTSTENGEFYTPQEIEDKTLAALENMCALRGNQASRCTVRFNPVHGIGKIIFREIENDQSVAQPLV